MATYLRAEFGARPVAIERIQDLLARCGLTVERRMFRGNVNGHIAPWCGRIYIAADLSDAEVRWDLTHQVFHVLQDNALEDGFACCDSEQTRELCRRANHGAKLVLVGAGWLGGVDRLPEVAAHLGVPTYQLEDAILNRV